METIAKYHENNHMQKHGFEKWLEKETFRSYLLRFIFLPVLSLGALAVMAFVLMLFYRCFYPW